MQIISFAIGNHNECFFEKRFTPGVNVIYSDDNNRGKTLLMQGIMFAIGNEPLFPNGFNYKDYYFYLHSIISGKELEFLRKGNSFFVKTDKTVRFFSSEYDFRSYFHQHIYALPTITKGGLKQRASFDLFYEVFFIPQDKRNPSNIINRGRFNKDDFKSMLFDMLQLTSFSDDDFDEKENRLSYRRLQNRLKVVKKKLELVKKSAVVASYVSKFQDLSDAHELMKKINKVNTNITHYKNERNRNVNKISGLKNLITELNSLNKTLTIGALACGDCKSKNIVYANKDVEFDVSNSDVRKSIVSSIREEIQRKTLLVNELNSRINHLQDNQSELLKISPPDLFELALFKDEVLNEKEYMDQAHLIQLEMDKLNHAKLQQKKLNEGIDEKCTKAISDITDAMKSIYTEIDPNGSLNFSDIFSKKDAIYSGSDSQEYYFCRLYALNQVLQHEFPLIVDSFRDGELSSVKEERMLKVYESLGKQVILTSTLKSEEYKNGKYKFGSLASFDYSVFEDHKLMTNQHSGHFNLLLDSFMIRASSE
ncbi:TPA: hypothetical protein ACOJPN_004950 [Vibrio harveyi]|uniref:hypothetical protein n=1 Tax=Vibrio harveyi TaxID=669 RepID=UPI00390AE33C